MKIKTPVHWDNDRKMIIDRDNCPVITEPRSDYGRQITDAINDHAKLKADLEKAVEGLRHYADESKWERLYDMTKQKSYGKRITLEWLNPDQDGYDTARQTLEEIGR